MLEFERVNSLLRYDRVTGKLFWKVYRNSQAQAGQEAGYVNPDNYIYVGIDGEMYPAHCVIWLLEYGYYPTHQVDHADHNRSNNLLSNLEEVGFAKNQLNKRKFRNNTSGFTGVNSLPNGKFIARAFTTENGKRRSRSLGTFNLFEDAVAARKRYLLDNGYHANHGL